MIEDRFFERPQVRARLEAELVHKMLSRPPIDLERFRLSARAVERDHQLPTQSLPITVLIDQRLELSNEVRAIGRFSHGDDGAQFAVPLALTSLGYHWRTGRLGRAPATVALRMIAEATPRRPFKWTIRARPRA